MIARDIGGPKERAFSSSNQPGMPARARFATVVGIVGLMLLALASAAARSQTRSLTGRGDPSCSTLQAATSQECGRAASAVTAHETPATFKATGRVESVDRVNGTITLDQGAFQAMGWPVLAHIRYVVSNKHLIEQLIVGQRFEIEFEKRGADYVLTSAKQVPLRSQP